jgi:hypothetical protein
MSIRSFTRSFLGAFLGPALAAAMAWAGLALPAAAAEPTLLFSYEALALEPLGFDPAKATYDQRVTFTEAVLADELPTILAALDIPPDRVETEITPGGYLLHTNASLQSSFEADAATADRFASAVGYVFRQWSILVTDFTPEGAGNTGFAVVTFADDAPSGDLAQAFFEHAAKVNEGLGGGYTAFGRDLYFLNVADGEGKPYSGIDDETFVSALAEAAGSFAGAKVSLSRSGRVGARFIENDWEKSPEGQDYAATLGAPLAAELEALRTAHEARLGAFATEHGWK